MIETFLELLEIALVGRILLSFLPPGDVGSHRLRDLPVTIATSYVLGRCAWIEFTAWREYTGVWLDRWIECVPLVVLVAVRWITLPGKIVPPRTIDHERTRPFAALLTLASFAAIVWKASAVLRDTLWHHTLEHAAVVVNLAATCVLFAHGLRSARRDPISRAIAWAAAVVLFVAPFSPEELAWQAPGRLALVAGLSFAVAWWRRADQRALALASLSFAGSSTLVAIGSLSVLVAATARPSRARALAFAAIALAALQTKGVVWAFETGAVFRNFELLDGSRLDLYRFDTYPASWLCLAAIVIAAAIGLKRRRSSPERELGAVDAPRREAIAAIALAVVVFAAEYFEMEHYLRPASPSPIYVFPAGVAFVAPFAAALVFGRSERVAARSAA